MNTEKLLESVANKYRTCGSYSDRGTVETSGADGKKNLIDFKTCFVKPQYFRFEWTEADQKFLIGADGHQVFEQHDFNNRKIVFTKSLETAIAGASGISYGGVWIIPSLLIPQLGVARRTLIDLKEPALLDDDEFFRTQCHVLRGSSYRPGDTTIWVGINDFTVWRVREEYEITADEYKRSTATALASVERLQNAGEISREEADSFRSDSKKAAPGGTMRCLKEYHYNEINFEQQIALSTFNPPAAGTA